MFSKITYSVKLTCVHKLPHDQGHDSAKNALFLHIKTRDKKEPLPTIWQHSIVSQGF